MVFANFEIYVEEGDVRRLRLRLETKEVNDTDMSFSEQMRGHFIA